MSHEKFLRSAVELARTHSAGGRNGPFGALVVKGGKIVGEGWNRVVEISDPTAHAEVLAIRDACARLGTHDLSGCVLYASCEPCPMCLSAAYWARIQEIHFAAGKEDAAAIGFDDSRILEELGRDWANRDIESQQSLREEGRAVLRDWAANPDRVPY